MRSGHSYEIALKMGYANRGSPWKLMNTALKATVNSCRKITYISNWPASTRCRGPSGRRHWQATSGAASLVLRIIAQRAKLLGLHKPETDLPAMRTLVDVEAVRVG